MKPRLCFDAVLRTIVIVTASSSVVQADAFYDSSGYSYPTWDENAVIISEACRPRQVHLAYGDSLDEIVVVWATVANCSTHLEYGFSEWQLDLRATGYSAFFWENYNGLQNLHRVKLTNLKSTTTYFYRPLSDNIGSGPFYFKTPRTDALWSPEFLVFGDLGIHTDSFPSLVEEALKGEYTALLHVGDFAYNLRDNGGLVGDRFMELIEPVAAFLPYMTSPGNHEIDTDTFTHYCHRFSMPGSPWPMKPSKQWYSFDVGPIHFVSYSSEVFFVLNGSLVQDQFDWLRQDLRRANGRRRERPWIIAFGHRPMYCTSNTGDDCTTYQSLVRMGLEDLFYHYGVDLVLQAHEHNYERLYPVYRGVVLSHSYTNPSAPIHIISGAAGSKHRLDPFMMGQKPAWSAFRQGKEAYQSYGRLRVVNATHLYWEQHSIEKKSRVDSLWIKQNRHGRFHWTALPSGMKKELNESMLSQPLPPELLETEPDEEWDVTAIQSLIDKDKILRISIGASFGAIFSILLVIAVATRVCRRRHYTKVRRWDTTDLNYGKRLIAPSKMEDSEENDSEIDMADLHSKTLMAY